jgi:hypothetical protein
MIATICVLTAVVIFEFLIICSKSKTIHKLKDMLEEDESILSISGHGHEH